MLRAIELFGMEMAPVVRWELDRATLAQDGRETLSMDAITMHAG